MIGHTVSGHYVYEVGREKPIDFVKGNAGGRIISVQCPVCDKHVPDLLNHAREAGDDHGWIVVMES